MPKPTPSASPERLKLASAIDHARQVAARRVASEAALEAATQKVYRCHAAVGAAETAITEAEEALAGHLVDAAQGVVVQARLTPRQAREALAAAEIALSDAQAERAALAQHNEQFRHDSSARLVNEAAVALMSVELAETKSALAAEGRRLGVAMQRVIAELLWLSQHDIVHEEVRDLLRSPLPDLAPARAAAEQKWAPILAGLVADADAPAVPT